MHRLWRQQPRVTPQIGYLKQNNIKKMSGGLINMVMVSVILQSYICCPTAGVSRFFGLWATFKLPSQNDRPWGGWPRPRRKAEKSKWSTRRAEARTYDVPTLPMRPTPMYWAPLPYWFRGDTIPHKCHDKQKRDFVCVLYETLSCALIRLLAV